MSKGEQRLTAKQKLEILREAEQPEVTVSQVCRRHALAPSVFYRWRAADRCGPCPSEHHQSAAIDPGSLSSTLSLLRPNILSKLT